MFTHIYLTCVLFGVELPNHIRPLFTLQLRIIKTMFNIGRRTPTRELISHYKLFPPQLICYLQACVYAFKCIKYNLPAVFELSVNKVHSYNSRKPASITMKHCRTRRFDTNGLQYFIGKLYNDLDAEIKSTFKKRLKNYIVCHIKGLYDVLCKYLEKYYYVFC